MLVHDQITRCKTFPSWTWAGWLLKGRTAMDPLFRKPLDSSKPPLHVRNMVGDLLTVSLPSPESSRWPIWMNTPVNTTYHLDLDGSKDIVTGCDSEFNLIHQMKMIKDLRISSSNSETALLEIHGVLLRLELRIPGKLAPQGHLIHTLHQRKFLTARECDWSGLVYDDDPIRSHEF